MATPSLLALPTTVLQACLQWLDTVSLLRCARVSRDTFRAADATPPWWEATSQQDSDDDADAQHEDENGRDSESQSDVASLSSFRRSHRHRRAVLLHSGHASHLLHPSLVRSHASIDYLSAAGCAAEVTEWNEAMSGARASKVHVYPGAAVEFEALKSVQHLRQLIVHRSADHTEAFDDERLRELLNITHVQASLYAVYISLSIADGFESNRSAYDETDGLVEAYDGQRVHQPNTPSTFYLTALTLAIMGSLSQLHTLCIQETAAAVGLLPLLHSHMPQLERLALMGANVDGGQHPELPSEDVIAIGLCPRLHTLCVTGNRRWSSDGGDFFLRFFSQPHLRTNLRHLELAREFTLDMGAHLRPALCGLASLRSLTLFGALSPRSEFRALLYAVAEREKLVATELGTPGATITNNSRQTNDQPRQMQWLRRLVFALHVRSPTSNRRPLPEDLADFVAQLPDAAPLVVCVRAHPETAGNDASGAGEDSWASAQDDAASSFPPPLRQSVDDRRVTFLAEELGYAQLAAAHPTRVRLCPGCDLSRIGSHLHPLLGSQARHESPWAPLTQTGWAGLLDHVHVVPLHT